jgi:hypothetical protein
MIKDVWKNLIIPLMLLLLFFMSIRVLESELISTLILLVCIGLTFGIRHHHKEWLLFSAGTVLGIIFEIGGDALYKMQYWSSGSFFGIPYWLPLLWGFGFVIIHRFGSIIVEKTDSKK